MKTFIFKVEEQATYIQEGTVSVEAESLEEARQKALRKEYDHLGDNEIDYNTETSVKVLKATVL